MSWWFWRESFRFWSVLSGWAILPAVEQTGYVTTAERTPDPLDYPGIDPGLLVPGSLVFFPADRALRSPSVHNWWRYVPGACWNRPEGPGSSVDDRLDHPVVHVTLEDALSYARWAGKDLPTETEWELAARGGLEGAVFVWGDEERPGGRIMANTWQGEFPWQNLLTDGFFRTSPVGSFPPNGYGLYDMAGNVWEWTSDPYRPYHASPDARPGKVQKAVKLFGANGIAKRSGSCCRPPDTPRAIPQYVVKGGSHLCAPNYCMRYRPAARQGQEIDSSTSHIGFR